MGNNTLKNHSWVHAIPDCRSHGNQLNVDSSIGESNHKVLVKQPGRRTQMRSDTFDEKTASFSIEHILINQACATHCSGGADINDVATVR